MAMWKTRLRALPGAGQRVARLRATYRASATHRLLRGSHGQGLVEFALILPVLLSLIFGIFEFGRLGLSHMTAKHAVAEATRYAVTGRQLVDPESGDPIPRAETIRQVVRDNVGLLAIADSIVIDPPDGGGPEDLVTVSVNFKHRFFLPGLDDIVPVDFTVRTAMKNEPFIR
ncbi:MAG: pilus assembly protein [marine benthic group bacterium]|nr:pilus assembly protein [Candidatus Benthicola marisminoris]